MRIMKFGSIGDDVRALQRKLTEAGYKVRLDGKFGRETRQAVRDFQKARGIAVDGEAGGETIGAFSAPTPRGKPESLPAYNEPVETADLPPIEPPPPEDEPGYGIAANVSPGLFSANGPSMEGATTDAEPPPVDGQGYGLAAGGVPMPGMAPPEPSSAGLTTDEAPGMDLIRALAAKAARHEAVAGGNSPLASGLDEYSEADVVPPPVQPLDSLAVKVANTPELSALARSLASSAAKRREAERYEQMPESIRSPMDILQAVRAALSVPRAGM